MFSQKRAGKQPCRFRVQIKGSYAQIYTFICAHFIKVRISNPASQFEEVNGLDSGFFISSRQHYCYLDTQSSFWQKMSRSHLHSILISPRLLLSFWISGFGWEHYRAKRIKPHQSLLFWNSPSTNVLRSKPVTQTYLHSYTVRNTSLFQAWIKKQHIAQFRTVKALPPSSGLMTSSLFPSHLLLHTYTLQLAAAQHIKWNINWGLGARWGLYRNNLRGKQREQQPMHPSPLQRFLSRQLLEKAACTFCGNAHTACYLMYAFPSFIHYTTAGLNATVQRLFSFPGKKIHTERWQCWKCHSPETKHCYLQSEMLNCFKHNT